MERFEAREKGTRAVDIEKSMAARIETQRLLERTQKAIEALEVLLDQVNRDWKNIDNRILGHIVCSPAITLGVGEHRFTEDWGVFQIDRARLGNDFQGNKLDLGMFSLIS
jgi:hypothetical protein